MEFSLTCPIDGPIDVGLEDIESVVLREPERADITFVCPHCGTQITVTAAVPSFLLSAIEALASDPDAAAMSGIVVVSDDEQETVVDIVVEIDEDDPRADAYCEYFRRQLSGIGSVEDALAEIDSVQVDAAT